MKMGSKIGAVLFKKLEGPEKGKKSALVITVWVILAVTLYGFFLCFYLSKLFRPVSMDESQWIWVSQKYFGYLLKGDLTNPDWNESYMTFGKYNPKIAQYLIGASLYLSGELKTEFSAMKWDWERKVKWNVRTLKI